MNTGWDDEPETLQADAVEKHSPLPDGIHKNIDFSQYLLQDRASKSGLWKAYNRTPAHAQVETKLTKAMTKGSATHCALLEPDEFTKRYKRGPEDRRGNKWKMLAEEYGEYLLTSADYDNALALRDAVRGNSFLRKLTGNGAYREITACATCPETGLRVKARADGYVPGDGIIVEVKTTADVREAPFKRVVRDLGYHMGEAHYSRTWKLAGGDNLKAFIFVVIEPDAPYAVEIYELDADAVSEGEAIREKAMWIWADCLDRGVWPPFKARVEDGKVFYDDAPKVVSLGKYDFRETVPVNG